MDQDAVIEIGQQALKVAILTASPILMTALVIGLFIGMIQAATQIQEMSLSFVPKLIFMAITLSVAGRWMISMIVTFTEDLIRSIPTLIF